jgi:prepilin-type processing-associated H-X9-DG protein
MELLVVLGILVVLVSIFVPYLARQREAAHRVQCANNLGRIRDALFAYANENGKNLPRVIFDPATPGYTAFTGPDEHNPFAPASAVKPNDVSASLWLLVRTGMIKNPKWFICPSSGDRTDSLTDSAGNPVPAVQRGNFRSARHLSYAYASPFSATFGSAAGDDFNTDKLPPGFALMADKGPGPRGAHEPRGGEDSIPGPAYDAPALELARANSNHHNKAGQNVLYADGHVAFQDTPYCGNEGDNIYSVLWPTILAKGHSPPAKGQGYAGRNLGPSYPGDSYLVPTDIEGK